MQTIGDQLNAEAGLTQMLLPDLWQHDAVTALRQGHDVVVQAPTGAGKTLIFELWANHGRPKGRAVYTVPTRALANDKLAEWRAKGWRVGIATGDLAEDLDAPILVATLETQKHQLIRGKGPTLLVVDEYQMIGDPDRGLNYELAIALAPESTQLLLLSGSVANPQDVVKWLTRLGRRAVLVRHDERPVPLEEVHANSLGVRVPAQIRGYWPRLVARALAENLGPILIFAPQRQGTEALAADLARQLPESDPLLLTPEQKALVGERLAKMLKTRVAFHHSGLSYAARAGVVEPLAKAGQLRVVVATMGLAAGINFSLRTVALAGHSYRRDEGEQLIRPDEILQMFGRAGRRGIDETGYVLVSQNEIRLIDAHPLFLSRNGMVDWPALLGLMRTAADAGVAPYLAAVRAQERLFTSKPIVLGVEQSLRNPAKPCGLETDAERARRIRRLFKEMLNSRGEWESMPVPKEAPAATVFLHATDEGTLRSRFAGAEVVAGAAEQLHPAERLLRQTGFNGCLPLRPALSEPEALTKLGTGSLCRISADPDGAVYGRVFTVAECLRDERVLLAKWVRRMTNWHGRQVTLKLWREKVAGLLERGLAQRHTPVIRFQESERKITATVSLGALPMRAVMDRHGVNLWRPPVREVGAACCAQCDSREACSRLSPATGTATLWRRLRLVDEAGVPTRRGRVVSYFSGGDGLAIAAGLEEGDYPVDEMAYDLACLDAGFRFAGDENRWAGRLALACHHAYGMLSVPGYLEHGLPLKYGAGADQVVTAVHREPGSKHEWVTDRLGVGDIDRAIIEWRSLLRQVAHAPELDWDRWAELQGAARQLLAETESPTLRELPPLEAQQRGRVDHRLRLRLR
ncbi:MAG: DEAD/DEAH box helicase [Verrucomicrobiales bacterium]|nr:DEAD/DEAH box helicase [Verrucomicrobiales bacterium]